MLAHRYCQVAIDTPLRRTFDYSLPEPLAHAGPGMRVQVPFGRRQVVGLILRIVDRTDVPADKLREVGAVLDDTALLGPTDLRLLEWAAGYYHHPIGEVVAAAVPKLLRTVRKRRSKTDAPSAAATTPAVTLRERPHELSPAQRAVVDALLGATGGAGNFLLDGVTGSGKTEVYLQACAATLTAGGAVLVLCPEIGLTPQLLERFERRFDAPIAALHSGLTDGAARACLAPGCQRRGAHRDRHALGGVHPHS